jgi:hypothetical protein
VNQSNVTVDPKPFECIPHWLLFDAALTSNALRVWLILQKHRDYDTGECWPGRRRLAEMAHLSVKTIDRALATLTGIGAITVTTRKKDDGSNQSNLYQVHWDRWGKSVSPLATEKTTGGETETTHEQRPTMNKDPRNQLKTSAHTHFDEFWKAYPRKKDKGHARKAWDKAVKTTDPAVIVSAAVQFRQWCEQDGTEPEFTPYPATWINGERWTDERDASKPTRMDAHIAHIQELWETNSVDNPQKQLEG